MLLSQVEVNQFKSIEKPLTVSIDPNVTVFVGMNEAGKSAFLQALHKSDSVDDSDSFNPVADYPRRALTTYLKEHGAGNVAVATELTYTLSDDEIAEINRTYGTSLPKNAEFSVEHKYDNTIAIGLDVDEEPVVKRLVANASLSKDARDAADGAKDVRDLAERLSDIEGTDADDAFLAELQGRIKAASDNWKSVVANEVWRNYLKPRLPKFLYFDDYHMLPGKVNLADLAARSKAAKNDPSRLTTAHRGVLALLRMADIDLADLSNPDGYETIKAKLEGISNSITDQVFEYWKQNENLEVEFDIRADAKEEPPFNDGPNLYIRIRNKRHRVTVPFDQRSKGFIWFFSFLVWFDSIQHQVANPDGTPPGLILLLDEPGLSLHALAQADFLAYIEQLSANHQVLYTTHSPFMVESARFERVRVVEDRVAVGTVISENVSGSSPRTLFPLQAALGYTIAQNLFISKRNLLVEGPADLIYLRFGSAKVENAGLEALRDDVTIVPTGGLDKVATFIALLGANELELVVVHDSAGAPDTRLGDLVREKLLPQKAILTYGDVVSPASKKGGAKAGATPLHAGPADVEDIFTVAEYLSLFNGAFAASLPKPVTEADLPPGDRIVDRLTRYLKSNGIQLRAKGGYNHYAVAAYLASNPLATLDPATLARFGALFKRVNPLFSAPDDEDEGE
ncbi:AAA family ATPase [Roseisolibacter agri]|uniref:Recombination protein F n=1 Tax=Roseisolibacter agri TaxID=2014610 RepID=A0AA37Q672_9BACT|nr:AAA family ATPase [Roseisolibacter agri]GLC27305.1 hypothetical protein rosag_38180 [Roseisolibacter agri]